MTKLIEAAPLVSAVISGIAAITSAIATMFAGVQICLARRNAVLQALQSFNAACETRESALARAQNPEEQHHAFNEFLNFLELYASVCNRRLVTGLALEIVRDRIIDSVVVIERRDGWRQKIEQAIFHSETFGYLRRFLEKHRSILEERRKAAEGREQNLHTVGAETATESESPSP